MARRAVKIALVLLCTLMFTTGCWDSVDIEDRDICTAIVVDKEDDNYHFYAEIPDVSSKIQGPQIEQSSQGVKESVIKGSGKTYAEARADLDKELNKPVYLGAVQSLILTERLADFGIEEYALRLRQMIGYRKTMDVIITPDDPKDILGVRPSNAANVGFAIEDTLENMRKLGLSTHLSLAELLQKLVSNNPCYLINTLAIKEGQITLIGETVFHGGKRIGFIPFEDSRGVVMLGSKGLYKPRMDNLVTVEDKTVTLETTMKRKSIKAGYDGSKPIFNVNMKFESVIQYPSDNMMISDNIKHEMEEKVKEQIKDSVLNTIEKSQKEYACDYLSFSEPFRIAYPDIFENSNWEEEFKKAEFQVNISVKLLQNRSVDYNPKANTD